MNSFVLWHRDPGQRIGIAAERRVLRAREVPALQQAHRLVAELQQLWDEEQARVLAACEAAQAQGHAQGWAQAQALAQSQLDDACARLAQQHEVASERLQQALASLALDITCKLIGALPAADTLARLATQAARELLPARTWRLHVGPGQVDALRAALQAADPQDQAGLAQAEIVSDPDLGDTACRLTTEFGTADASLATQVQRLARTWGVTP